MYGRAASVRTRQTTVAEKMTLGAPLRSLKRHGRSIASYSKEALPAGVQYAAPNSNFFVFLFPMTLTPTLASTTAEHQAILEHQAMLDRRMEFRVSEDFKKRMEEIADEEEITVADLFRRAIGLYDIAHEYDKKGIYMAFVNYDEHGKPNIVDDKVFSL